jgi:hypothetical protein
VKFRPVHRLIHVKMKERAPLSELTHTNASAVKDFLELIAK